MSEEASRVSVFPEPCVKGCAALGLPGRVFLGAVLAVGFGTLFKETQATDEIFIKALKLPGKIWLRMLKMVVLPLVFSNVVTAIAAMKSMVGSSKMGGAVTLYYTVTTILAAAEGLILSYIMLVPNVDVIDISELPDTASEKFKKTSSLSQPRDVWGQIEAILEGFTPTNVMGSAASGDLLGILSFAIMFALALPKGSHLVNDMLQEVNRAMFSIIEVLIVFTPVGVFSLVIEKIILLDISSIASYIGIFLATVFVGLAIHNFVTYPAIYFVMTKKNPFVYMHGILPAMFAALGTSSSASTLPVTIRCAVETNGIPPELAKFVLSLGATVNMDGTAIGFPTAIFFLAYSQGMTFTIGQAITTVIVASLSSMGAAPIPSAGLVLLISIMETVDVPLNAIFGLIIAVDWIYDRPETMTNIVGDSFAVGILAHLFGEMAIVPIDDSLSDKLDTASVPTNGSVQKVTDAHDVGSMCVLTV